MKTAAHENPEDRTVRVRLSDTLLLLNRKDEAAAVAKSALDGSDDTEVLNDAGYVLAETGLDLPYAEEVSRKSINVLEAKTAAITPAEVNSNAFAQSRLLIAAWDTLGWILFREGKLEQAEPLIIAGWRNAFVPDAGIILARSTRPWGKRRLRFLHIALPRHPSRAAMCHPMFASTSRRASRGSAARARQDHETTERRRCRNRVLITLPGQTESAVGEPSACNSALLE